MGEAMHPAVTYLIYIVSALVMLGVFTAVYTAVTRYKEFDLVREGNIAAAMSYGGALVGFSLTLASSIAIHASFVMFLVWGVAAMAVQIVVYVVVANAIRGMNDAIVENNIAMGGLLGAISLAAGIVNAACLT
ncbi:putative membrane protein [Achromobacter sp. NFACC18-2]|nr:putative membrane protein [Achromobacter sp. NFACC18-2]